MSDPNTQVAAPDQVSAPVLTPNQQANIPPVNAPVPGDPLARERYEQLYGQPAPTLSPTASPTQPSEVVAPAANQTSEEVIQLITSLKAELEDLRNNRVSPPQPTQPSNPNDAIKWTKLIQEGKIDEADEFLRKSTVEAAVPLAVQEAIKQIEARMTTQATVEKEINAFNATLRAASPEVSEMEDVIASRVETELLDMQARGLVKDVPSYIDAYKKVTSKHVENAKAIIQRIRAGGKLEAQVSHQQVLVGSTPQPSSIRIEGAPPQKVQPQSYADIIRERQLRQNKIQGI